MRARLLGRVIPPTLGAMTGVSWYATYVDAPLPDAGSSDGKSKEAKEAQFPSFMYAGAQMMSLVGGSIISKVYMNVLNDFECPDGYKLDTIIKNKGKKQSVITVSNHTSTVDDPAVLACLLPWHRLLRPHTCRWSLCSQEYCFEKGQLISALCFSGKALPVRRGGGIDQKPLEKLFHRVQDGDWVHIFPEGKIVQSQGLGGREKPQSEAIGRLKWGVGKLIARAEVIPLVVPIYHVGMEKVIPQDESNKVKYLLPQRGVDVLVRVGDPIIFDDLLKDYREGGLPTEWPSRAEELELYSKITKRIEDALLKLEEEAYEGYSKITKTKEAIAADRHKSREKLKNSTK